MRSFIGPSTLRSTSSAGRCVLGRLNRSLSSLVHDARKIRNVAIIAHVDHGE
jgi:hypothetical protein